MKHYSYLVSIAFLFSCTSQQAKKNSIDTLHPSTKKDTAAFHQVSTKEFAELLLAGKVKASDDNATFHCLDSLLSTSEETRKFYYPVAKIIMQHSDGALSEAIGSYFKDYLKLYPSEAIDNYQQMIKAEQEKFVGFIAFEFYGDGTPKKELNKYKESIIRNCKNCSSEKTSALEVLIAQIWESSKEMSKEN